MPEYKKNNVKKMLFMRIDEKKCIKNKKKSIKKEKNSAESERGVMDFVGEQ